MSGSIYGTIFRVSTWGESHGKGLGVVVDGCPAGIPLTETVSVFGGIGGLLLYVAFFGIIFYLMLYRPQKKQQQKTKAMLDQLEVGDSVLTTSGFYGVVIDITDDTVIVEFGNNKNCRIPMQKAAITQLEKPGV